MKHLCINWTKTYRVDHTEGIYYVYISSHKSGHYYGAILYYIQNKNRLDKISIPAFEFKLEQFVDIIEDNVYNKCVTWLNDKLKNEYNIIEVENLNF